jgi:hypothetical protein
MANTISFKDAVALFNEATSGDELLEVLDMLSVTDEN